MIIIVRHPLNLSKPSPNGTSSPFRLCPLNRPCRVQYTLLSYQKNLLRKKQTIFLCFGCMRQVNFPDMKIHSAEPLLSGQVRHKNIHKSIWNRVQDWLSFLLRHAVTFCPPTFFWCGIDWLGCQQWWWEFCGFFWGRRADSPPGTNLQFEPPLFQSPEPAQKRHSPPPSLLYFLFPLWIVFLWENKCYRLLGRLDAKEMGCGVCDRGGGSSDVFIGKLLYYVLWLMTKHLVLGSAWTISSETGQLVAMHILACEHSGSLASQSRTSAHYWKEQNLDLLRILQVFYRLVLKTTRPRHIFTLGVSAESTTSARGPKKKRPQKKQQPLLCRKQEQTLFKDLRHWQKSPNLRK